jgi:hypothetical protein
MIEKRGHVKNAGSVAATSSKKITTAVVDHKRKPSGGNPHQNTTSGRRYYHNTRPNSPSRGVINHINGLDYSVPQSSTNIKNNRPWSRKGPHERPASNPKTSAKGNFFLNKQSPKYLVVGQNNDKSVNIDAGMNKDNMCLINSILATENKNGVGSPPTAAGLVPSLRKQKPQFTSIPTSVG